MGCAWYPCVCVCVCCGPHCRQYKSRAKNSQEAHEAIRPTNPSLHPDRLPREVPDDQRRLYRLIWSRAAASQMKDAVIEQVCVSNVCVRVLCVCVCMCVCVCAIAPLCTYVPVVVSGSRTYVCACACACMSWHVGCKASTVCVCQCR